MLTCQFVALNAIVLTNTTHSLFYTVLITLQAQRNDPSLL